MTLGPILLATQWPRTCLKENNLIIKLVRHGESKANVGEEDASTIGDHNVTLTETGYRQPLYVGEKIGWDFIKGALLYRSTYKRTRLTMSRLIGGAAEAAGVENPQLKIYEDPRLREVEWGYDKPKDYGEFVDEMRNTHGKFFYRMAGGESPADCYDRISTFLETLMRQVERKNANKVLIVSHGLTMRCFVMRFLHMSIEDFDLIRNPKYCHVITITDEKDALGGQEPQFGCGKWMAVGIRTPDYPGHRPYPWKCPACKRQKVWPHSERKSLNKPDARGYITSYSRCEFCAEVLIGLSPEKY